MTAPLMVFAIEVATIVCALALAARVLADRPRSPAAQLMAAIAVNTACHVALSHADYGPWVPPAFRIELGEWAGVFDFARNTTPGLFMLLCFTAFADRPGPPRWLLALFAVQMALEGPARPLIPAPWRDERLLADTAPALLQTLFVGYALYWIVADWRVDLIEARRRARAFTLAAVGAVTLVSGLLTRVLIAPDVEANYLAHVALTAAALIVTASVLFQITSGDAGRRLEFEPPKAAAAPSRPRLDDGANRALARLTDLLEREQAWREEGLTLGGLAQRVGLPEYRLRKLIHERLGDRNFNALLHRYRIGEACRQLADPGLRRTPILTIALSLGYGSVNTFNRGFREITGMTPSAYRAKRLSGEVDGNDEPEGITTPIS